MVASLARLRSRQTTEEPKRPLPLSQWLFSEAGGELGGERWVVFCFLVCVLLFLFSNWFLILVCMFLIVLFFWCSFGLFLFLFSNWFLILVCMFLIVLFWCPFGLFLFLFSNWFLILVCMFLIVFFVGVLLVWFWFWCSWIHEKKLEKKKPMLLLGKVVVYHSS